MSSKKTRILIAAILAISIGIISFSFIKKTPFENIKVEEGIISGTTNSSGGVHIFKGIPFAAPPVGNLRWKEPQPVVPWSGIKKCDAFRPQPNAK